jgi:YidC/Oxa1 family membrane protein insertase
MKELQTKYKNDKEKLAQEQMALYKEHGVNPIGGCLPMVVQMPIWFALYQSLLQLSQEGLLRQGFLWIPSLAGPVSDYSGGIGWLWPLPPSIGWVAALAYLVMPVLLVVSQLYMQQMMMPSNLDPDSPQASMNSVMKFMPLMFGYFALIVPSGLTLYWFTSNLLAIVQQYFTQSQVTSASNEAGTAIGSSAPVNPVPANPVVANSAAGNSASANSGDDQKSIKDGRSKRRKKSRRKR